MKVFPYTYVEAQEADSGAEKVKVRWLITKEMGAPNFAMRLFEVGKGGCSPFHNHAWEHEVFILEGECLVICGGERKKVGPGYAVLIPSNVTHNFRNEGSGVLKFLCLIPHHE